MFKTHIVVQSLSRVWLCDPMDCSSPGFSVLHYFLEFKLMSTESVMPSKHLILSPPSPLAFNLSQYQGLFIEWALCIRWPKYWSFSFSISSSNEYSGFISFRIDSWSPYCQGTLKSLFQLHNSKAQILWHSASFMVQLSHLYMTTGKTIALTIWTIVRKVMSLFFNTLSRFVIASVL